MRVASIRRGLACCGLALALVAFGTASRAEPDASVPLEDQIDVVPVDRSVLAVNSKSGRLIEQRLEVGEQLLWHQSRGALGVAATSKRLLGVSSRSVSWQELPYRVSEAGPLQGRLHLGERVALVALDTRLVGLSQKSASWSELSLGPRERVEQVQSDANVALVLTGRRALAFPSRFEGFVEAALSPDESVEAVSLEASSVTLTTSRRVLVFRAGAERWTELMRVVPSSR